MRGIIAAPGAARVSRRLPPWLGWTLAAIAIAAFCAAGAWQLRRMHEKQAMLDALAAVLRERKPQPLVLAEDAARARDYDWAAGAGRFLDGPAVLLDNQQRDGRAGVRVYRAFRPQGAVQPMLVELGWLPLPGDRALPRLEPVNQVGTVRGLLLPPPSHGLLAPSAVRQPDGDVLATALDAKALPALLGVASLAPRVLRLDPALPVGYARDLDILPNTLTPDRHLGYAVQWFGLAAAVFVTACVLALRRRPAAGTSA